MIKPNSKNQRSVYRLYSDATVSMPTKKTNASVDELLREAIDGQTLPPAEQIPMETFSWILTSKPDTLHSIVVSLPQLARDY